MKQNSSEGNTWYGLPMSSNQFNGMSYRSLGQSGLQVPLIGLGTWKMGRPETGDGSRIDLANSLSLLDAAHQSGICFWDTANRYNNASGNAERNIGEWFRLHSSLRRNVVLCTKIGGAMDGPTPNHCGLSRKNIIEAVYSCLERLQTEYIDLLYFHFFDPLTPAEESLAAVEDLVRQQLVRYFAVSNTTLDQLNIFEKANSKNEVRTRILAVQNQYDLLFGEPEAYKGVKKHCEEQGISYIPWSPLARGLLSGKYGTGMAPKPGDRLYDEAGLQPLENAAIIKKITDLNKLAATLQIPMSQLVIAYMLTLPAMGPIIVASSNLQQLADNTAAAKIRLAAETVNKIETILQPSN